jgi:hypothetical protein
MVALAVLELLARLRRMLMISEISGKRLGKMH